MNNKMQTIKLAIAGAVTAVMLGACASVSTPDGSAEVREKLSRLQSNQELASRAPVAIKEAEVAVLAAEVPEKDQEVARHRVYIADKKIDIAAARAQGRLYEYQRIGLAKASENARLDARTREADTAYLDAERARASANSARDEAAVARASANSARDEAALALANANSARNEAEGVRLKNEELNRQLVALNARETDRGMIVTLGDVLFATGLADLNSGATGNLSKLGVFLNEYPDRVVAIEGYTDSVGSESSNIRLSQSRAGAVKNYLTNQGIASNRLTTAGMGEASPVAGNDTDLGRQQNRRVEVIISSPNQ